MAVNSSLGQIIAMGGGGFSMEPDNPLLDRYIVGLARVERPKICFIPTASGDSERYIAQFYSAFEQVSCVPSHLSLFNPPTSDLNSFVLEKDIIYVGGGNTKNLIALCKEWGLDRILREAWENGKILSGLSAGSICWFEEGLTDSIPGSWTVIKSFGFLKGSHCPHYDGEPERRPAYHRLLSAGLISEGYAVDDGVALHYVGDRLEKIVSSRPYAKAYRLEKRGESFTEITIQPQYLGD